VWSIPDSLDQQVLAKAQHDQNALVGPGLKACRIKSQTKQKIIWMAFFVCTVFILAISIPSVVATLDVEDVFTFIPDNLSIKVEEGKEWVWAGQGMLVKEYLAEKAPSCLPSDLNETRELRDQSAEPLNHSSF